MKKEKGKERARQAGVASKFKNVKNIATTSQSPTQGDIIHQSTGQSQAQSSSELHPAAFTPPSTSANPTLPIQASCWSLFLLRIGCISAPHASGHD